MSLDAPYALATLSKRPTRPAASTPPLTRIQHLTVLAVVQGLDGESLQFPVYIEAHGGGYRSKATHPWWSKIGPTIEAAIDMEAAEVLMVMAHGRRN